MIRALLRDSALYTLSGLMTRGLSLLLLPVYVRLLTQEEYGAYDLLAVIGSLVAVTVSLEVSQAVMRFVSMPEPNTPPGRVVACGFWWVLGSHSILLLVVLVVLVSAKEVVSPLLGGVASDSVLVLAALQYGTGSLVGYWSMVYRARLQVRSAVALPVLSAALAGGFSVALMLSRSPSIEALFAGQFVGQGVCVAFVVLRERTVLRLVPDRALLAKLLKFSAPLVLSSLGFVAMTYLDRFFVRSMLGLEALGSYGLASRIAAALSLLVLGFQSALSPLIYSEVRTPALPAQLARLFRLFVLVAGVVVGATALFGHEVIQLIAGRNYLEGAPAFTLLSAAVLVQGAYVFFPGLFLAKRTRTLATVNIGSLALNAVLNPLFIGWWGLTGSAAATLLSAAVSLYLMAHLAQRHFAVPVLRFRDPVEAVDQ